MKLLHLAIIVISVSLSLIILWQPAHVQNISTEKNATLILNFDSSAFSGYQGGSFTPSHDGSMYAYSTSVRDLKSGNWKASLLIYFLKNGTGRSLDLNSDTSQISDISFSSDDKKLLFVGNGCDNNPSHTTFYTFNLLDIHLKCNGFTNVHSADWMPDGSVVFLQNNEENDTVSIYQNGTQKLLYTKQITPTYISLNSSHIEFIKASPNGKKVALWYFVMLSHKTQLLDVDNGKIIDTFDGGHPRWSQDGNMLLYTNPVSTGYYDKGPRAVITHINLLDVDKNKTSTIDLVPVGVDDLFLSANGIKVFYVTKIPPPYEFLNLTSGMYEIDLNNVVDNAMQQYYLMDTKSPLKQFKSGVQPENVQCNTSLVLIFKLDHSPACVKQDTKIQLLKRHWGIEDVAHTRDIISQDNNSTDMQQMKNPHHVDPFVPDSNGKIDLSKTNLPPNKYGQIDYDKIGYLVSENKFKKMLDQLDIKYTDENFLLLEGGSLLSYPPFTDYCGYVMDNNKEEHWFSSSFHTDTLTSYKISNHNPEPCKPGFDSCFCNLQTKIAENSLQQLSYYTKPEEEMVGETVSQYLNKTRVVNVSNEFSVGKYNLQADPSLTHYCGKFTWGAQLEYFDGYIKDSNVVFFELASEQQKLCAINSDAKVFSFEYLKN